MMDCFRQPSRYQFFFYVLIILAGHSLPAGCEQGGAGKEQYKEAARPQRQDPAAENAVKIRVFLFEAAAVDIGCQSSAYGIEEGINRKERARFEAGRAVVLHRTQSRWHLRDKKGESLLPEDALTAERVEIVPDQSSAVSVGADEIKQYRGTIRCVATGPDRFAVVNVVDIESYLKGVVGSEMYPYWFKAALRAQSIAARTYALYQMQGRTEQDNWDIGSGQSSQVYGGMARENLRVNEAVNDTRGIVLAYGEGGREKIFSTYYSSICGGHTQSAAMTFGDRAIEPLAGRACPYCRLSAPSERYRWPRVRIDKKQLSDRLVSKYPQLAPWGEIVDVKVVARSDYGRVEALELTGRNNQRCRIRGEAFRLAVSTPQERLLSSWYELKVEGNFWSFGDGHGWGHGVGLCQHGCQALAREGKDCIKILQYYYPQAVLVRAY